MHKNIGEIQYMESFGRMLTILAAIFLCFMFPLQYEAQELHTIEKQKCLQELTTFVDDICKTGIINKKNYDTFYQNLLEINEDMEIIFEVKTPNYMISGEEEVEYYDFVDASKLFSELSENGEYQLQSGECVTIYLKGESQKILTRLQNILFPMASEEMCLVYGGIVW